MAGNHADLWKRYQQYCVNCATLGITLDISRMNFTDSFFTEMDRRFTSVFDAMKALEDGAIANPDEKRMVGHYWLRAPHLAPTASLSEEIGAMQNDVLLFAKDVHEGRIRSERNEPFTRVLVIGIGGSALGPQLAADYFADSRSPMAIHFFDNTDPDGIDRTLAEIGGDLKQTLSVVISKSGGTKETRNGMLETQEAYRRFGLVFAKHAVAVTGKGSELDRTAEREGWSARFPMWDWVGGRTSELSAVGLLPLALQGVDIHPVLSGAAQMDELTRNHPFASNPAAILAAMWYYASGGRGQKDMVVLPYKDRLALLSKYLQQLIMESLGKELDVDGNVVHQGLTVYGNKGSTDQHAYVQQLRDGVNNFFVTFIEVRQDRQGQSIEVEPQVTTGDYLHGFFQGTRRALHENGRESMTLSLRELNPESFGAVIALFERAVGFYASLIHVNAYHQPGVEAGKKAAGAVIDRQKQVLELLRKDPGVGKTAEQVAQEAGLEDEVESIYLLLEHLAANPDRGIQRLAEEKPWLSQFSAKP